MPVPVLGALRLLAVAAPWQRPWHRALSEGDGAAAVGRASSGSSPLQGITTNMPRVTPSGMWLLCEVAGFIALATVHFCSHCLEAPGMLLFFSS